MRPVSGSLSLLAVQTKRSRGVWTIENVKKPYPLFYGGEDYFSCWEELCFVERCAPGRHSSEDVFEGGGGRILVESSDR